MGNRENTKEIMPSVLKLMRAMRRRPMRPAHEFPPSVGRLLMVLGENDGESPARLCELMDVRPSSMSELLSGMEKHGLISRTENEEDKRATRVFLSESGKEAVSRITEKAEAENAELTACFTAEELDRFCELCDRLSAHIESLSEAEGCGPCGPHRHHGPHGPRRHHGCFGFRGHHPHAGGHKHHCDSIPEE